MIICIEIFYGRYTIRAEKLKVYYRLIKSKFNTIIKQLCYNKGVKKRVNLIFYFKYGL